MCPALHNIDWTATGTMALAIVAFASFWLQLFFSGKQSREARKASEALLATQHAVSKNEIGIRLYLQFTDRWDSASMHKKRSALAYQLIEERRTKQIKDQDVKEDVMEFFEDLGVLSRQGRLDEELAYSTFSYYVKGWWFACKPYIVRLRARKGDTSLFADFQSVTLCMMEREAKEPGIDRAGIEPTEEELADFLKEEYELSV